MAGEHRILKSEMKIVAEKFFEELPADPKGNYNATIVMNCNGIAVT